MKQAEAGEGSREQDPRPQPTVGLGSKLTAITVFVVPPVITLLAVFVFQLDPQWWLLFGVIALGTFVTIAISYLWRSHSRRSK